MDFYKKTKILGYEINSFVDTEEKNVWFLEKDILRLIDSIKNPSNKPPHRPIYTPPATSRGVSGGATPPPQAGGFRGGATPPPNITNIQCLIIML